MSAWHVLGAGAMGCLWAGYLARSGQDVNLLFKDNQRLEQFHHQDGIIIAEQGLVPVAASVVAQTGSPIQRLLITTKAHQTMAALSGIEGRLQSGARVLLVQNGMGIADRIAESYPQLDLYCAVTTDGAYCPKLFTVVHAGRGDTFIGKNNGEQVDTSFTDDLPASGLQIHTCNNIRERQWQKLAVNCAINGLTVIYNCRNGELLNIPEAHERMIKICNEIAMVGSVTGFEDWQQTLLETTEEVVRKTAKNYSSMFQDIKNRRCTEMDFINGYLIEHARQHGIACDENQKLYNEVKDLEYSLGCR